jgi:hypothetical protein
MLNVTTGKIATGAVTTTELGAAAVTKAKAKDVVSSGNITGDGAPQSYRAWSRGRSYNGQYIFSSVISTASSWRIFAFHISFHRCYQCYSNGN